MSISFKHVTKSFGSKTVLNDVSFDVATGEICFILGRSGTGKSVTLKHIVGLMKPNAGRVIVNNSDIQGLSETQLRKVRLECGMVFQHPALLDSLTIENNIGFALDLYTPDARRQRVLECLKLVHLDASILPRKPNEVSYGMQKRISLARTIAAKPKYLLFDEPTTGLDPITTTAINTLIFDLSRQLNVTSIVVSHDMGCALQIADKVLVLDQGRVLLQDTVENVKQSHIPLIVDFLKEAVGELSL